MVLVEDKFKVDLVVWTGHFFINANCFKRKAGDLKLKQRDTVKSSSCESSDSFLCYSWLKCNSCWKSVPCKQGEVCCNWSSVNIHVSWITWFSIPWIIFYLWVIWHKELVQCFISRICNFPVSQGTPWEHLINYYVIY